MAEFKKYNLKCTFADSDLDVTGRVSVAKLCDILQRGATSAAIELGVGMAELLKEGHSWMLSSMSVCFDNWPTSTDGVELTTWASGVKGRLVCTRDYLLKGLDGTSFIRATSDWIYVDVVNRKISRLTPKLMTLAPEGVDRVDVAPLPKELPVADGSAPLTSSILVRRADCGVNRHVNNVHYIEWLFEPLSEELFSRRLLRLDISYRSEAKMGEEVESFIEQAECGKTTLHSLKRKADGAVLVTAVCHWE